MKHRTGTLVVVLAVVLVISFLLYLAWPAFS